MEEVLEDIRMEIDVHCKWNINPPVYRLYVNDELFSERNFIWQADEFVTENLVMNAPLGSYRIRIETPSEFNFKLRNLKCAYGKAEVVNNEVFKI